MENNMIEKFGDLRVTIIDGQLWFVGKDIAESWGIKTLKKLY